MSSFAGFVLHVGDHEGHEVGRKETLDTKVRVAWAWQAANRSASVQSGKIKLLRLDVKAGTVNGTRSGVYAELLHKSASSASQLLPLMGKCWHPDAPSTSQGHIAKKLGIYERVKAKKVPKPIDPKGTLVCSSSWCSTPMLDLCGAKRAVWGMLVASVFAADLSEKEGVPVAVIGRPPGHHATCDHNNRFLDPEIDSPSGKLGAGSLDGGCFYPSCWVSAVHSLRQGFASRLAYIDIDAHKPDGIWKEVEQLRGLGKQQRAELLGRPDQCEKVFFSSVHIDAYPNPSSDFPLCIFPWNSVRTVLPKKPGKAFEVSILEELLPKGLGIEGKKKNKDFLEHYDGWQQCLKEGLRRFKPNGIFIGMGFDLHSKEKRVPVDKRPGIGIKAKHYTDLVASLPSRRGPVVLTMEGGYTKEAIMDGMEGILRGMEQLSKERIKQSLSLRFTAGLKRKLSAAHGQTDRAHKVRVR